MNATRDLGFLLRAIPQMNPVFLAELKRNSEICDRAKEISDVYLWVLFAVGVPGNVFTIITTLTMQAMSPATFFVALLAFFDGGALIIKIVYQQLIYHKLSIGAIGCKLEFLVIYLATVANWMLVLICAERFVSVCYPLKKVSVFTKRRSYYAAVILSVSFLIFYGIFFIVMRTEHSRGYCDTIIDYKPFWVSYWYWINASTFLFIPFLFIFILTVGIIRGLRISRRDRRSLLQKGSGRDSTSESTARNNKKMIAETERVERSITIMMILAAVLFLAFALPACLYNLMSDPRSDLQCNTSYKTATWSLFKQIQHIFADSTHALNFFLYFIAARRFREQLFKLLRCKAFKKERFKNKYQHTYSTQLSTSTKIDNSVFIQSPTTK